MRIGVDIMGGDFAPDATILGSVLARAEIPVEDELVLFGDKETIVENLTRQGFDPGGFSIVHTPQSIGMGDHPARSLSMNPESGIVRGLVMLKKGEIDGFASAGNTGAVLVGSVQIVNSIPGIIRPCIAATIPNDLGNPTIILDVGLNPDSRPDVLYQYGMLGSIYAELVYNIKQPRVGLLNIGVEEEKGNLLTRAAFQSMKGTKDFNFIGNVEGNNLFHAETADVIVCDGFIGNVLIKEVEAFYSMLSRRKLRDEFIDSFNFENYGGTPVLGIHCPVIIGHGISNENAIKNMILHTRNVIESRLIERIKEIF